MCSRGLLVNSSTLQRAIFNISRVSYSRHHNDGARIQPGGLVPSNGLKVSHAERVFQEAGTFPLLIARVGDNDSSFYRQLHSYVESGFPLFAAMHGRNHAIAIVGYEWRTPAGATPTTVMRYAWDEVKSLVAVDDNYLPYLSIPSHGGADNSSYSCDDIDAFIVALPEKVFYPADAVDKLSETLFRLGPGLGLPLKDESILRYFITTGSALRHFMRERESEFDRNLLETVMSLPFAQFVWIVEVATAADWAIGQISARAILDATASLREVTPFWLIHSRTNALIFNRSTVGDTMNSVRALALSGMSNTAFYPLGQELTANPK